MKNIIIVILIILLSLGLGYFFIHKDNTDETVVYQTPSQTAYTTPAISTTTDTAIIRVTAPVSHSLIKSPVTVSGEARGNWYFEASFPIKVVDANGKVLGSIPAQAQGDWMTTNLVPFNAVVTFASSTTATGEIILEKDNPSGLPQNEASVRIPIRFR